MNEWPERIQIIIYFWKHVDTSTFLLLILSLSHCQIEIMKTLQLYQLDCLW